MGEMEIMTWRDWRGRKYSRAVNLTLDIRALRGSPGFALLVVAANPHLSLDVIRRWLASQGVGRSLSWIQRRRWLFRGPEVVESIGPKRNADGMDDRARALMSQYATLSLARMSRLLSENGIRRSREWVRRNRCGAHGDN